MHIPEEYFKELTFLHLISHAIIKEYSLLCPTTGRRLKTNIPLQQIVVYCHERDQLQWPQFLFISYMIFHLIFIISRKRFACLTRFCMQLVLDRRKRNLLTPLGTCNKTDKNTGCTVTFTLAYQNVTDWGCSVKANNNSRELAQSLPL